MNYQAIMKFSLSFLATSIAPPFSVFTFRRQANLLQGEGISKVWTGWSLSIDQICHEVKWTKKWTCSELRWKFFLAYWLMLGDEGNYLDPFVLQWRRSQIFGPFIPLQPSYPVILHQKKRIENRHTMFHVLLPSFLLTHPLLCMNCLTRLLPLSSSISQISKSPYENPMAIWLADIHATLQIITWRSIVRKWLAFSASPFSLREFQNNKFWKEEK